MQYVLHPFLYQVSEHQVSVTSISCYNGNYSTGLVHIVVMYCSLAKSGRLICIVRSWEFRFAMLTSVRAKRFTGSSGKTSLEMFFKDRLLGLRKIVLHEVAAGKLPLIVTFVSKFLHHFCIIS